MAIKFMIKFNWNHFICFAVNESPNLSVLQVANCADGARPGMHTATVKLPQTEAQYRCGLAIVRNRPRKCKVDAVNESTWISHASVIRNLSHSH